jgi:hypothetical protein
VIYNITSASRESAQALHAQSKNVDVSLPVDPSMPLSLQMSRNNANAAAAQQQATPAQAGPAAPATRAIGRGRSRGGMRSMPALRANRGAARAPNLGGRGRNKQH